MGGEDHSEQSRSWAGKLRFWEWVALFGFVSGIAAIAAYSSSLRVFSTLVLIGLAAWLGGSLIGFLFGIPRLSGPEDRASVELRLAPNSNLVSVSDWLTKIIIGATLVQLDELARGVGRLAQELGREIGTPGATAVAGASLLFFFFVGFLWGYLWCSLRIYREIRDLIEEPERAVRAAQGAPLRDAVKAPGPETAR